MFGLVCDHLGSHAGYLGGDGLTGHSIILYMSSGARALIIALCLPRCAQMAGNLGIYRAVGDRMVT